MKNYLEITMRYLMLKKKRTLMSIIGIILSTSLIAGVGTIGLSFWDKQLRDAVVESGDCYVSISGISSEKAKQISGHVLIDKSVIKGYEGIGGKNLLNTNPDEETNFKGYQINAYSKDILKIFHIDLKSGRMPENENEIVVSDDTVPFLKNDPKVGDKIDIEIEPGAKENTEIGVDEDSAQKSNSKNSGKKYYKKYTIVGLANSLKCHRISTQGITLYNQNSSRTDTENTVYIKLKSIWNVKGDIGKILKDAGIEASGEKGCTVTYNDKVLKFLFNSTDKTMNIAIITTTSILLFFVIISMVAVIYNAFNISVFERITQFGILRCVGATPAQIRRIVFKEATILGCIGIPIGIACGTFVMQLIFLVFRMAFPNLPFGDLRLILSPYLIIVSTLMGFAAVYFSAFGPARKAGKIPPIEAVRNVGSLKKEKFKKVSSGKLYKAIFGTEGWIARKNLSRNRKRLGVTVFSMVVSIVMFLVFSSFDDLMYKSGINNSQNETYDFTISSKYSDKGAILAQSEYNKLKSFSEVERVYTYYQRGKSMLLGVDDVSDAIKEIKNIEKLSYNGKCYKFNASIVSLGDDNLDILKKYLTDGKIDVEELNKENGVIIVNTGSTYNEKTKKNRVSTTTNLKPGDMIKLKVKDSKTDKLDEYKEFKITAVLKQGIWMETFNQDNQVNIYTSKQMYDKFSSEKSMQKMDRILVKLKKDANSTEVKKYLNNLVETHPENTLTDSEEERKNVENSWLAMEIFIYGFVSIIALIGFVNVQNTISTNIILRTRELSILKAVGMTGNGIKKLVCLESVFYGLMAIAIGNVIGCGLSRLLYKSLAGAMEIEWTIPWKYIIMATSGTILVTLLSGILPLKRINDSVIVENIRKE